MAEISPQWLHLSTLFIISPCPPYPETFHDEPHRRTSLDTVARGDGHHEHEADVGDGTPDAKVREHRRLQEHRHRNEQHQPDAADHPAPPGPVQRTTWTNSTRARFAYGRTVTSYWFAPGVLAADTTVPTGMSGG